MIMPSLQLVINNFAQEIHSIGVAKGFWTGDHLRHPAIKIALIHKECSALLECFREAKANLPSDKATLEITQAEEEIADIIIRALDLAAFFKLDIGRALAEKHRYNQRRPHKHGKAF